MSKFCSKLISWQFWLIKITTIAVGVGTIVVSCDNCGSYCHICSWLRQLWILQKLWSHHTSAWMNDWYHYCFECYNKKYLGVKVNDNLCFQEHAIQQQHFPLKENTFQRILYISALSHCFAVEEFYRLTNLLLPSSYFWIFSAYDKKSLRRIFNDATKGWSLFGHWNSDSILDKTLALCYVHDDNHYKWLSISAP